MKLSEFTTADALVLRLAQQGWNKTPDGNPDPDDPNGPFFTFVEGFDPEKEVRYRALTLYPQAPGHWSPSDLGIGCSIDEKGRLFSWQMFECNAGSMQGIDSTAVELTPFGLGELLTRWELSWWTGTFGGQDG